MADVRPFPGFRYDPKKASLTKVLCPPYDVIDEAQASRLRAEPLNAVHMELPAGEGAEKYAGAARIWKQWRSSGVLTRDTIPSFYVVEERYSWDGKSYRRVGFLSALGVTDEAAADVVAHERTLAKPKEDRLNLLDAVGANVSPIFGLFPDPTGAVRKTLAAVLKKKPVASGQTAGGVKYRLWQLADAAAVKTISKTLASKKVLIADGHHRFEVSREHWRRAKIPERETVLAYLCPEEDAGLIVLPTHRITAPSGLENVTRAECAVTECRSRAELLRLLERSKSPYAYGLLTEAGYRLAEPKTAGGCKSGLCVEWLGAKLLAGVAPDQIKYTPDAKKAEQLAAESGRAVVFVKPMEVPMIRKAVKAVGLLPQKSTYFYPKIATGLVFKALEDRA